MKNWITTLFVTALIVACASCDTSINNSKAIYYKLNIVFADKIAADTDRKFPADIINICKSVDFKCEEKFFFPTPVTLNRLSENPIEMELKVLDKKATNFKNHVNHIDNYFINGDGKFVRKDFLKPNPDSFNKTEYQKAYLASLSKKSKIFFYDSKAKTDSVNLQKVYNNVDSLKYAIVTFLCDSPNSDIVILIDPIARLNIIPSNNDTNKKKPLVKGTAKIFHAPPPSQNTQEQSIKLAYAKYRGEIRNGKPCGLGTMFYYEEHTICKNDSRIAKSGEKVVGVWVNGELSSGTLYNSEGKEIGTLKNGTTGDCN